ncbi:MAG TPA: hypothetical protein VES39_02455, partial [Rhodospirillales bacterium]|nr:hypothetical protein [Rhodospirillales bacterium]
PAAHAIVRVEIAGGRTWVGLADEAGRFAVLLPYPPLADAGGGGSPPVAGGGLRDAVWPIAVRIRHDPPPLPPVPGSHLPDYRSVLRQAAAPIWPIAPGDGGLPQPEWLGELRFGEDVVIRTAGSARLLVGTDWSSP